MSHTDEFRIKPGSEVNLAKIDPAYHGEYQNEDAANNELQKYAERLNELQALMYAENKHALLIVLQAMDGGGKDGTIRHVMSAMNPQGCSVVGFKVPTEEELAHEFLWRVHQRTPRKGHIAVFNRSHYEDVLVVRVHNLVPRRVWEKRYNEINAFERQLTNSGMTIVKFFLHIDQDEQLRRFGDRLDEPDKQWKISEADYAEREFWDDYQQAYMDALSKCNFNYAPWYIIPANHKWYRNLVISQILVETLENLKLHYPEPATDLAKIRKLYHTEVAEASGKTVPEQIHEVRNGKKEKKKKKKKKDK
ncbi:MAG: polyphosphate kinase 2 [Anaerolineales bacterium]|nr:polyphosphate kinase 2 family protein [Anaerolineae bacterium]PWB51540.1 MAG: polyphosphate kinase 2 [Anaerolineales bacterium]